MSFDKTNLDFSTLVASIAHDMKNSLGLILNSSDTIHTLCDTVPEVQPHIKQLQFESRRLNNDFIQLLTLYRIENKQYFTDLSEHSIVDCLEEVVLQNIDFLALNNINIFYECSDELMGFFDQNLVLGVLNTVVNNTYRYAKSSVAMRAFNDGHCLILEVSDDGQGYPSNILNTATIELPPLNSMKGHTGLGLHFAEIVAGLHKNGDCQGGVTLTNNDTGGACFQLRLPK